MHRALMAGMSLLALAAVAGCAQDDSALPADNFASGNTDQGGCMQGNTNPHCTDASRFGSFGSNGMRGNTDMGLIDDPIFGVRPQNRHPAGNEDGR